MGRFISWAEKGANHRKNNPFLREIKRGVIVPNDSYIAESIDKPAYDLNKIHCKPLDGSTFQGSPSDPSQITYGSKRKRQSKDESSIYNQAPNMSSLELKRTAIVELLEEFGTIEVFIVFLLSLLTKIIF